MWTFRKSTSGRQIYINGSLGSTDTNMERLGSWAGATVGRYYDRYYQGVVYEILIYNTDLTQEKREKVEGYLAHKWGLSMNLPNGHLYKSTEP